MSQTISYSLWKLLKANKIEIPVIQRDYAQGREGKEFIRENFLKYIYESLKNNKQIKLDFVYGYKHNGVFCPLDGQQRITTLWLIHLYIAWRTNNLEKNLENNIEYFQNFTYCTRVTSKDFCKVLCAELKNIQYDENKKLSKIIMNQNWFYSSWKQDPTVMSMLRMIDGNELGDRNDGISKVFVDDVEELKKFWLILTQKDIVTFDFLDIENSLLSASSADDLYIKMNARGKPLTDFENFKADLIDYYEKNNSKLESMNNECLAECLDGKWLDIILKLHGEELKYNRNVEDAFFPL